MDISSSSDPEPLQGSVPWAEPVVVLLNTAALLACITVVSVPTLPAPAAHHPLPECRAPTNCVRTSQTYAVPAATLFGAAQQALDTLGATRLHPVPDSLRAAAVYRVGVIFTDDVTMAVTPGRDSNTLHLRSASRLGLYDFEVNRRRVENVLEAVEGALPQSGGP